LTMSIYFVYVYTRAQPYPLATILKRDVVHCQRQIQSNPTSVLLPLK
jgi:hypothetical protein